jgi:hypothetical protein
LTVALARFTLPELHEVAAWVRVLKSRTAHSHLSIRTEVISSTDLKFYELGKNSKEAKLLSSYQLGDFQCSEWISGCSENVLSC